MHRRSFLHNTAAGVAASSIFGLPALVASERQRPVITHGFMSGDVVADGGIIWSRADRPAQLWVDVSRDSSFSNYRRVQGTAALANRDFNAHAIIDGLESGRPYFYRIRFESLEQPGVWSAPEAGDGVIRTAPTHTEPVRFCWSGDTAGQGWGIDPARGGMRGYASMLNLEPDFFVHSGDLIYADGPMKSEITLDDGSVWKNQLVEAKTRVAESTQDFRENFLYNLLDANVRDLHRVVPVYNQWDDHEVTNNWYPGEILEDDRYAVKSVDLLAARAREAFFNCNPLRVHPTDPSRIYRKIQRGPLLDLFFIDLRSYRGANSPNLQQTASPETAFLGSEQLRWLKSELLASKAEWKIICSDMPLGVVVSDWEQGFENGANADDGPAKGRELEIASLLRFVAQEDIPNVHFITADVHYCASHYYDPAQAATGDFKPFWEFVSGPLHAGTFGPNDLDGTFGPQAKFVGIPDDLKPNRSPADGYQFFGCIDIDPDSRAMTVAHYNADGDRVWDIELKSQKSV